MAVAGWNPAEYSMRQQSRRDDMMRNILNMFMQKKQFEMQDRRYQDQTEQQKFQNEMSQKKYELDAKEAEDRGNYYNRPQSESLPLVKLRAVMTDPNYTPEQKRRYLATGSLEDPITEFEEKEKIKSKYNKSTDTFQSKIDALGGGNYTEDEKALLAMGIMPNKMLGEREDIKTSRLRQQATLINERYNKGEISGKEREEELSILSGRGAQYYESESSKAKARISSVTETGKLYQSALGAYKASKEPEKLSKEYRQNMGIFVEFPKEYTMAKINTDKGIASESEISKLATLEYLYSYMDRGGDLDDLSFEMVKGMDNATVLRFRRMYQKKYNPETYK